MADAEKASQNETPPDSVFVAPSHLDAETQAAKEAMQNEMESKGSATEEQMTREEIAIEAREDALEQEGSEWDEEMEEAFGDDEDDDNGGNRLQLYTPSSLLSWGQYEVKFFQQLYTQTEFFDGEGNSIPQGGRSNFYSGIFNFTLGYNQRVNFGFDAWVQGASIDPESGSPFKIFSFPGGNQGRFLLSAIGPKVKWQPFRRLNNFTLQSSLLLPVARDPEGRENNRPFVATQNHLWWTQIFYTWNFHRQLQLFAEIDLYWNIDRRFDFQQSGFFATPASVFFSYFPTNKATLYVNSQFWPTLGEGLVSSWWYQAGIGGKYQVSKGIDLEASVGRFLAGRGSAGPATTYNFGVRFVKW